DQEEHTNRLAIELANRLVNLPLPREFRVLQQDALSFREAHEEIQQIRIYGQTPRRGLVEEREPSVPSTLEPEAIPVGDEARLRKGEAISRVRERGSEGTVIYAAAPMIDDQGFQGVVSLTTVRVSNLSQRLVRLTVALLAVAIISITALLYF